MTSEGEKVPAHAREESTLQFEIAGKALASLWCVTGCYMEAEL